MLVGLVGTLCATALLWNAPDRTMAGWMPAVVLPWGLLVSILPRGTIDLRLALAVGLVSRAVLVGSPPLLSDDLFRFLFEGVALNAGHNPFLEAPATLGHLDPWLAERVNHAEIPSIYPPTAQWWFRAFAVLGARPIVAQGLTAAVDVANVALLHRILARRGLATWPALVYALHPLAVLESANGAHLEPFALLFCFGTVLALADTRPVSGWLATVLATLGIGVKLLPVLFVPAILRRMGLRQAPGAVLTAAALLALLAFPVLSAGPALFEALDTYSRNWSFNGFAYPVLEPWLGGATRTLLGVVGIGVALHAATFLDPLKTWRQVGAAFLLLSPTVHPWYVLWVLGPALALGGRAWAIAAVFLQCSYVVLTTLTPDGWTVPWWLGLATWGPATVVLVGAALRPWLAARSAASG